MIRSAREDETKTLLEIASGTGVFKPMEIDALKEVLDDYHAGNHQHMHRAVTREEKGRPIGFAYYAPIDMTDRTWILYWIFVDKKIHSRGIGSGLLAFVEADVARAGGRVFLIETSCLSPYEPTRRFYLKHGYEREGVIRDYYSDGDDMVIFRKRIQTTSKV